MEFIFSDDALTFKAFCDENRLQILSLLSSGEKCACKLLESLHIGQPALSYHMKILVESGRLVRKGSGPTTVFLKMRKADRRISSPNTPAAVVRMKHLPVAIDECRNK